MTDKRKKRPLDDTQTEFGPASEEQSANTPAQEPELEVRLPAEQPPIDDTSTSPDPLEETATNPHGIELDESPTD